MSGVLPATERNNKMRIGFPIFPSPPPPLSAPLSFLSLSLPLLMILRRSPSNEKSLLCLILRIGVCAPLFLELRRGERGGYLRYEKGSPSSMRSRSSHIVTGKKKGGGGGGKHKKGDQMESGFKRGAHIYTNRSKAKCGDRMDRRNTGTGSGSNKGKDG